MHRCGTIILLCECLSIIDLYHPSCKNHHDTCLCLFTGIFTELAHLTVLAAFISFHSLCTLNHTFSILVCTRQPRTLRPLSRLLMVVLSNPRTMLDLMIICANVFYNNRAQFMAIRVIGRTKHGGVLLFLWGILL